MTETVRTAMTSDAFLKLSKTNHNAELINGECVEIAVTDELHKKTFHSLVVALLRLPPDGEFYGPSTNLYLDESNIFRPTLFFLLNGNTECNLKRGCWYGAPELVIEIFSPDTDPRDKTAKFEAYERQGVYEYWIVNPQTKSVDVWLLDQNRCTCFGALYPNIKLITPCFINHEIDFNAIFKWLGNV